MRLLLHSEGELDWSVASQQLSTAALKLLILCLCLAAQLGIVSLADAHNEGKVVFINNGLSEVVKGEIEVCGQRFTFAVM